MSLIQEEMPWMPDLHATGQVVQCDADPWSLALEWAVLKAICRMPGPTTDTLVTNLLPGAIRLRDLALARFLLKRGPSERQSRGLQAPNPPPHSS